MLKVVHEESEPNATGAAATSSSLLDEIVRDGARQMLAAALQAEAAASIEAHRDVVDEHGRRLVVRNGYHAEREITTAAGAVAVRQPRVNDKRVDPATGERMRFSSASCRPGAASLRRSPKCCRCSTCTASRRRTSRADSGQLGGPQRPGLATLAERVAGTPPSVVRCLRDTAEAADGIRKAADA
jgi:hypothetical protein